MTFLEKFKGKTAFLNKLQIKDILGQNTGAIVKTKNDAILQDLKGPKLSDKKQIKFESSNNSIQKQTNISKNLLKNSKIKAENPQTDNQTKKIIQNPFLVQNEFFLDEEELQFALKKRKQRENFERLQKQRKKRQQIEEIMMKSLQKTTIESKKQTKRQWIKMGGLGANIGGEQWTKKKALQQKMMKFAQQVKNKNKLSQEVKSSSNKMTVKDSQQITKSVILNSQRKSDIKISRRDVAIRYSKSVQKPPTYILQKLKQNRSQLIQSYNNSSQNPLTFPQIDRKSLQIQPTTIDPTVNQFNELKIERNYSQLQKYEDKHQQYKKLVYQNY